MRTKNFIAFGATSLLLASSILLSACGPSMAPPNPLPVEAGPDASSDAAADAKPVEDAGSTDAASD